MLSWILFPIVSGWTDGGHMLVAEIAKLLLDEQGKERLSDLSEHFYSEDYLNHRKKNYPKLENTDDLAGIAVWMDNVNLAFPYQRHWHFVDQFIQLDDTKCGTTPIGQDDIIWGLNEAVKILDIKKLHYTDPAALQFFHGYWLRVIVHLMGDLHQPLHNCSACSKRFPHGDRGGNDWKIKTDIVNHFHGRDKHVNELHLLWDLAGGQYVDNWPLDDEKHAVLVENAKKLIKEFPEDSLDNTKYNGPKSFKLWHELTYKITPKVYQTPFGEHITDEYLQWVKDTTRRQIAIGGYRLANVLKSLPETFSKPHEREVETPIIA